MDRAAQVSGARADDNLLPPGRYWPSLRVKSKNSLQFWTTLASPWTACRTTDERCGGRMR